MPAAAPPAPPAPSAPPAPPAHTVHVGFRCPDAATADAVRRALLPEAHDPPEGSQVALEQEGPLLHLHVGARDLATLRAALHGSVRLVDAALRAATLRAAAPAQPGDGNP